MENPLLMTVDDLAKTLRISRAKAYSMLSAGKIGPMPLSAFGNRTLFDADKVRRWVRNGRCCPREKWLETERVRRLERVSA